MQRYIISIFVLFIFALTSQAAELRNWTGSNGKTIEAEFVSFDGKIVKLKNASGKELNVLLSLFSKEDQEFVKNGGKETTDDPFGEDSTTPPKRSEFKPPKIDKQAAYLAIIKELEKALKEAKQLRVMVVIYCHLASVQVMAGQKEAAKKNFEKAKELSDKDVQKQNVHFLAIAEAYLGNYNEAKSKAKSFATICSIADVMTKQGAIDEAKKILEENIALITKESSENLLHPTTKDWAYYQTASQQAKSGFFEEAKVTSAKIESSLRFSTLQEIGKYQLLVGKVEEAQNTFSIAQSIQNNPNALARIAAAWADAGYIEKTLGLARQCNDPKEQSLLLQSVAKQQIIEGKIDDAKKNLEKTLSLLGKDYNNIDANISIIVLYVAMGDEKTAEQVCKLTSGLIEQNPDLHKRAMDWERLARNQQFLITNTNIGKQLIDRCITIATSGSIEDKFETNRILRFVAEGQDWLGDEKSSLENYDLAEKDAHKVQSVKQREGAINATMVMRDRIGWTLTYPIILRTLIHIQIESGKFDESITLAQKLKQPCLRARILKLIAEELYEQID